MIARVDCHVGRATRSSPGSEAATSALVAPERRTRREHATPAHVTAAIAVSERPAPKPLANASFGSLADAEEHLALHNEVRDLEKEAVGD